MRELTKNEIEQVDGGFLPVLAWVIALGGKLVATNLAGWAFGSAALVIGTYQAADYLTN